MKHFFLKIVFVLLSYVIVSNIFAQENFFEVDSNTIALWRFNEGEGCIAYDASENGNHAIIKGAQWVETRYGMALEFDGIDDEAVTPNYCSQLEPYTALTLEAVIYAYKLDTSWNHIIDKVGTYALSLPGGKLAMAARDIDLPEDVWWMPDISPIDTNVWLHVVGQYDGTQQKLFVNDTLVAIKTAKYPIVHNYEHDLTIGCGNIASIRSYFFNGVIDEIRISKVARYTDPTEINSNSITSGISKNSLNVLGSLKTSSTTINYSIDKTSNIKLTAFSLNGRLIKVLLNNKMSPGNHTLTWNNRDENGNKIGSGLYIIKLAADNFTTNEVFLKVE